MFKVVTDNATGTEKVVNSLKESLKGLSSTVYSVNVGDTVRLLDISSDDLIAIEKYNKFVGEYGVEAYSQFTEAGVQASDATTQLMQQANGAKIEITQMANAQKASAAAGKAMLANIGIALGVSLAIAGIAKLIDYVVNYEERILEVAETSKSAIEETISSFESLKETTNDVKYRYAELAQGVSNLGTVIQSQGSLSTDEYNEFLDLSNQLSEVFPQLTKGYDDNGNAILNLSGNVDTIVDSLNSLIATESKLAATEIMDRADEVYLGYTASVDTLSQDLKNEQRILEEYQKARDALLNSSNISQDALGSTGLVSLGQMLDSIGRELSDYRNYDYASDVTWYNFSDLELTEEDIRNISHYYHQYANEHISQIDLLTDKIASESSVMKEYINSYLSTDCHK